MKIEEIKLKNIKEGGVFVQIGTNNANDFFMTMCMKFKPSKVLLVEPHSSLNSEIEKCYDGFNYTALYYYHCFFHVTSPVWINLSMTFLART